MNMFLAASNTVKEKLCFIAGGRALKTILEMKTQKSEKSSEDAETF